MSGSMISRAALAAAGALALTAPAAVASSPGACFLSSQWQGWRSPSPDVIYLRVNINDIYKVTLSAGSSQLQSPDVHLVSIVRGSSRICSAIDLDLRLSDSNGFRTALIAKTLTKLTPEEIAAIPKKYRP
ncbi:MAG: DUF6491 family protein [Caulobacteraceae bacterium]